MLPLPEEIDEADDGGKGRTPDTPPVGEVGAVRPQSDKLAGNGDRRNWDWECSVSAQSTPSLPREQPRRLDGAKSECGERESPQRARVDWL